jgi:hypothetical protein
MTDVVECSPSGEMEEEKMRFWVSESRAHPEGVTGGLAMVGRHYLTQIFLGSLPHFSVFVKVFKEKKRS